MQTLQYRLSTKPLPKITDDVNPLNNPLFQTFQKSHRYCYDKVTSSNGIILLPLTSTLQTLSLQQLTTDFIESHCIVPYGKSYITLNQKEVLLETDQVIVGDMASFIHTQSVFCSDKYHKFQIIWIFHPISMAIQQKHINLPSAPYSFTQALDFFMTFDGCYSAFEDVNMRTLIFAHSLNDELQHEDALIATVHTELQTLTMNLCTSCVDLMTIFAHLSKRARLLTAIHNYCHSLLHSSLINAFTTFHANEDKQIVEHCTRLYNSKPPQPIILQGCELLTSRLNTLSAILKYTSAFLFASTYTTDIILTSFTKAIDLLPYLERNTEGVLSSTTKEIDIGLSTFNINLHPNLEEYATKVIEEVTKKIST
ncbi:hypothetical protein QTN25_004177 [Entamoeba marina]